ncbi:MAG: M15 family metallopeptidase [Clostridia bacterium]|nr:M15 family metallopeptidase [Clostridia bacterium]
MALEAMCLEMQALKVYDTNAQSAYRSYSYQKNLYYNKYMEREREKYPHLSDAELMIIVDTYSARPGTSDHQTGLTLDFSPINSSFVNTKAFTYLTKNAHKFGFILRYPKGKENITGYKYEPWHWRFVGRDVATYIYEHGITLEEYMAEVNDTAIETFPEVEMPSLTPPETTKKETTSAETTPEETTPIETTAGETTSETTPPEETTPEETTTEEITTTEAVTTTEEVTTAEATTEAETTSPPSTSEIEK